MNDRDNTRRQMLEVAIVRALIRECEKAGFKLDSIYDGEDYPRVHTTAEALSHIFNLDECTLRFKRKDKDGLVGVFLVLGNGEDMISDYTADGGDDIMNPHPESFAAAIERVSKRIEEQRIALRHDCTHDVPAWRIESGARGVCINCGRNEAH